MIKKIFLKISELKLQDYAVVILFFIGIFLFLSLTGTINSGYHFIDDHSMISMKNSLDTGSFLNTSLDYVKNDLNIRFRPLYYFYYVSEVQLFGVNFFALSLFTGMLAFFAFSFFYIGMRKLSHSYPLSVVFVLLMFLGPQAAIWWRLGTNETIAMFFLGLSFLFMGKCFEENKFKSNTIYFVIFLTITSLCKESFTIVIPAFIFFKIWNEKNTLNISIKESLIKNYLLTIPLIAMFMELLIIKFVVGTNKIGYAGVTSSVGEFITGIKNILFNEASLLHWIEFIGGLIILYLVSFIFLKEKNITIFFKSLKSSFIYFCFSILIILPNIFMHAKSGMVERYLLPTTLGLAFLVIGILKNTKQKVFKILMFLAVFAFISVSFNIAKTNAINFANEGNKTNLLLSTIKKYSKPESNILLVADPVDRYEVSWSIKTYLSYYGLNNFYAYPMTRKYKNDFELGLQQGWEAWFKDKKIENIAGNPDTIVIFDKIQSEVFFAKSGINIADYKDISPDGITNEIYLKL